MFNIRGSSKQIRPEAPGNRGGNRSNQSRNPFGVSYLSIPVAGNMNATGHLGLRPILNRGIANSRSALASGVRMPSVGSENCYYEPLKKKVAFKVEQGGYQQPWGIPTGCVPVNSVVPNHYELQAKYAEVYPSSFYGLAQETATGASTSSTIPRARKLPKMENRSERETILLSGSVNKVYEWVRRYSKKTAGPVILFNVYSKLQEIFENSAGKVRFTIRDGDGRGETRTMACVYYPMDRPFPTIEPGEYVRCVVRMQRRGLFQCVSVSEVSLEEFHTVQKLQFLSEKTVTEKLVELP